MPKMKTKKAIAKRFRVKKSKKGTKVIKRSEGQDHFNARQTGKTKRNKRSDSKMTNSKIKQTIIRAIKPSL